MNEYSKYKLFRKYKTEDGVNYTPLDEYQALSDGSTNNCDCGYREYEYIDTNEDVCSCVITDNDIVENEPSDDNLLKPYRKYIEIEKCPYDESYNQETGVFKYVGDRPPSLDCANCDDINLLFEWSGTTWIKLEGNYSKKSTAPSIYSSPYGTYSDPSYGALPDYITKLIRHPNTSKFTSMSNMFNNCKYLTDANLSNFDTSNVTDMYRMFYNCNKLTSLDLTSFDTSQVTDMEQMFSDCYNLISLDLSNFNTSQVTDMSRMFDGCKGLTSLNLSNWDLSNVTDMEGIFYDCYKLTSLDLSNWNTSNVSNMSYMFERCSGLTSVIVNDVDSNSIQKIGNKMRNSSYCSEVTNIEMITNKNYWDDNDFISMNVSIGSLGNVFFKLNDYQYYFNINDKVKYLTLNEDGTYNLNVTLKDLWEIDLNKISFDNLGHYYINEIYNLPVTKETTSISFKDQSKLKSVNAKNWDTSNVTSMNSMFSNCSGLTSLDLSSFDTSNVTDMRYMFEYCSGLTELNLSNWDLSNIGYTYTTSYSYPNTNNMFYFCNNLTSLDLSNWVFSDTYILHNMFYNTSSKLKTIKVSGWNTTNLNKLIYEIKEYYTGVVLEGDIINIG